MEKPSLYKFVVGIIIVAGAVIGLLDSLTLRDLSSNERLNAQPVYLIVAAGICLAILGWKIWWAAKRRIEWQNQSTRGVLPVDSVPAWRKLACSFISFFARGRNRETASTMTILVADLQGPSPETYRVTETIVNGLVAALGHHPCTQIIPLGTAITETQGSPAARAEGKRRNASIVIWGWYSATAAVAPICVHFELLLSHRHMDVWSAANKDELRTVPVSELDGFRLQVGVSEEMAYLSLVTAGIVRYVACCWQDAIAALRDALNKAPGDTPTPEKCALRFYIGTSHMNCGEYQQAIENFTECLKANGHDFDSLLNRAVALTNTGQHDRAAADFDLLIRQCPGHMAAYVNRAALHGVVGDHRPAIEDCTMAIKIRPDAAAFQSRAIAYSALGQSDLALSDYSRAINLAPREAGAYYNRGNHFIHLDDGRRALRDYKRVTRLRPEWAYGHYGYGLACAKLRKLKRAIKAYTKAITLDPSCSEAYFNRALALQHEGHKDLAISDLQKCVELEGDSPLRRYATSALAQFRS